MVNPLLQGTKGSILQTVQSPDDLLCHVLKLFYLFRGSETRSAGEIRSRSFAAMEIEGLCLQSGIFTANLAILSLSAKIAWPYQQALPKAIKGNLVFGKNSQFTANVGNLAG